MTCDEFQRLIEDAIDCRLDGQQLANRHGTDYFETHAAKCPACHARWQEFQLLESALVEWRTRPTSLSLSAEFTDRVLREVTELPEHCTTSETDSGDGRTVLTPESDLEHDINLNAVQNTDTRLHSPNMDREHEARSIRAWEIVVTVALVLIAVLTVFRNDDSQLAKDETDNSPSMPFENSRTDELADLTDLLSDARMALAGITERASEKAGQFRIFVPDVSSGLGFEHNSLAPQPVPAIQSDKEPQLVEPEKAGRAGESDSGRLRRALDFLFEVAGPPDQQTT